MPSITGWWRIEGRARRPEMEEGLRASVADPLWMLGRQHQLGAFRGEDAGTPVGVAVDGHVSTLSRYVDGLPGQRAPQPYSPGALPLETLVEREPPSRSVGSDLRTAAESGLRFLDELRAANLGAYVQPYANEYRLRRPAAVADDPTSRLLDVLAGRVPDGHRLYAAFRPPGTASGAIVVPAQPPVAQLDVGPVTAAAQAWVAWYDTLFSRPPADQAAWVPERMEYAFSVAARGRATLQGADETVLVAREYRGGHLDWHAFDVDAEAALGAADDALPAPLSHRALATPAVFGGMPTPRWFELEDARINFGRVSAGPPDLARLLLIEYAALYGNDHFVVPMTLDVGSLCRIDSFVVLDTFGARTRVVPTDQAGDEGFTMFRATDGRSAAGPVSSFLFLPPSLGPVLEGRPTEEVALVRDEMANLGWAIERVVEAPSGGPLDRFEALQAERRRAERAGAPVASADGPLRYRVQTDVPANWIPLAPVQAGHRQIRLQLRTTLDDAGQPVRPLGRLLRDSSGAARLELYEEELPRAGIRLTRSYHHARWVDGSTQVWIGRAKRTGRGEGSSGLRFDVLARKR